MFKIEEPLVSVVLPCYNVEEYVEKAISSIALQTYKNIEIIAINDGSTDGTLNKLEEISSRIRNLQIIDSQNKGYGSAVQKGIDTAKGKYVCILEPDDWWDNFYLEPLVNEAEGSSADAVFYNSYHEVRNNFKKTLINQYFHGRFVGDFTLSLSEMKERLLSGAVGICFGIYNKQFLELKDIKLDKESKAYEDVPFIAQIYAKSRHINLICGNGYNYRRDIPNQSVTNFKRFESILKVVDNFYHNITVSPDISDAINGYFINHLVTYYWKANNYELKELQKLIIRKIEEIATRGDILTSKAIEGFIKSRVDIKNLQIKTIDIKVKYANIPSLAESIKTNRLTSFFSFAKWKLSSYLHTNAPINSILYDIYPLIATPGVDRLEFYKSFLKEFFSRNDFIQLNKSNQKIFFKLLCDAHQLKICCAPSTYFNDVKILTEADEVPFAYDWLKETDNSILKAIAKCYRSLTETNVDKLNNYLNNKSVAIVGNSPCELNLGKGKEIDNHDIIIRFNNFEVSDKFAADYGNKTNIWCITPTLESIHQRIDVATFDFVLMPLSNRYIAHNRFAWLQNIQMAGVNIALVPVTEILKIYDMRVVSLGLLMILYILNQTKAKQIDIYGFSLSDQIKGVKHYFSGDPSAGKLLKFHDWMKEALFLNKMINDGYLNHE